MNAGKIPKANKLYIAEACMSFLLERDIVFWELYVDKVYANPSN